MIPDKNRVVIVDRSTPLVVTIGDSCSGKTLLSLRMFAWLACCGYRIEVDRVALGSSSQSSIMCDKVTEMLALLSDSGMVGRYCDTLSSGVMLYRVLNELGKSVLQWLDVDTWWIHNYWKSEYDWGHKLLKDIRVVWIYVVPCSTTKNVYDRPQLVEEQMSINFRSARKHDRHILLCTKADLDNDLLHAADNANNILRKRILPTQNLLKAGTASSLPWMPAKGKVLPFSVGQFIATDRDSHIVWGPDIYVEQLWKAFKIR